MQVSELAISGAFVFTPEQLTDDRGTFLELFKADALRDSVGHSLKLAQANVSISGAGVLRGIHFADVPVGQAKYVTCITGSVLDVVVDVRVGSPTFGKWDSVRLDTADRRASYLAEGLGHAFLALEDNTTVVYLCSEGYAPDRERTINPFDPDIAIDWPAGFEFQLSAKDLAAPSMGDLLSAGLLPDFRKCESFYEKQR